ncbi:endolytic transglycosylase MltG [Paeniglutamicibacter sp. NPDC012692]|uniref:endolytic transglycosylase MltG n=1 Tax=Paeniglutamicibacter sp. NPDC012692 TaxID=3364388 RepID=UPI003676CE44
MTNESSFDSSRHENEVSPRRAARAARQRVEAGGNDPVAPVTESDSAYTAGSAVSAAEALAGDPVAPTEAQLAAEQQRAQAVAAAQRARTEGALRARSEAIEAQRAAAERVRETLRANAAGPRRARSASGRSAVTPDSAPYFTPSAAAPAADAGAPFDQDHRAVPPVAPPTAMVEAPAEAPAEPLLAVPPAPTAAPPAVPTTAPEPEPAGQRWDAREHAAMSFNDILSHPGHAANGLPNPGKAEPVQAQDVTTAFEQVVEPVAEAPAPATQLHEFPVSESDGPDWHETEPAADPADVAHGMDDVHAAAPEARAHDETPAPVAYGAAYEAVPGHESLEYHYEGDEHLPESHEHEHHEYQDHELAAQGGGRESLFLGGPTAADLAHRKRRRRRRNAVMAAVLLGFCAVIFGVVIVLQGVMDKLNPKDFPAPGGATVSFEVKSGWGPQQIGRALVEDDIVASDKLFLEAIQMVETENRVIHPGKYDLRLQMPALDAATILIGDGPEKVGYVAIKQNTRMPAVLEEISKATGLSLASLENLAGDPAAFGIKGDVKSLEGFLHPGEYRFPIDSDAEEVLQLMVDATKKALTDEGITDPAQQYRVLTIASILQAEARPDDYATVAGALENRLHASNTETNGLLQVDSTVIYGLDRYTLHFTQEEKQDAGNKYNSYVHKGLPPTPIGSPGTSAIKAAANPKANDYYYWVTVNTNTGETKFAKTYREHQVNQNEFRVWCAANTDVCK